MLGLFAWWLTASISGSGPGLALIIMCVGLILVCLFSFGNPAWSKPFRIARSATLLVIALGFLLSKSGLIQPFFFGNSCVTCSAELKNLARELERHLEKKGQYPATLDGLPSPSVCPPNEVNSVARRLYGWQGITFENYRYELTPEGYTLSCQTCYQRWHRKPGYPRYDSSQGLEETGLDGGGTSH